jgi:hypothetical protein
VGADQTYGCGEGAKGKSEPELREAEDECGCGHVNERRDYGGDVGKGDVMPWMDREFIPLGTDCQVLTFFGLLWVWLDWILGRFRLVLRYPRLSLTDFNSIKLSLLP